MFLYDGLDERQLAERFSVARCLVFETVQSTLDIVHQQAGEGAENGLVVLADEQVRGRGRHGRSWYSPPGRGIWLGYLWRPRGAMPTGGVVGVRVGLAVAAALDRLGIRALLKWPNDVMLGDRKVAGILCEARWKGGALGWIAVGIGINVLGPMPEEIVADAVTLSEVSGDVTRLEVLEQLMPQLGRLGECETLSDEELVAYAARDWLRGRRLREPVAGSAQGVAADGTLLVEGPNGLRRVGGGSVVVE